jgi:hypothetical protein
VAEQAIALMKSRRRIASPQGSGLRRRCFPSRAITSGIYDQRNGVQGSVCTAAISRRSWPLWVINGHW